MPKSRNRRSIGGATNETEVAGILLISAGIAVRAIVLTSGRFTAEATEDARDNGVELWDGKRLNVEFDRIRTQMRNAEELIS